MTDVSRAQRSTLVVRCRPGIVTGDDVCNGMRLRDVWKAMERSFFAYILANRARGVMYVGVTNDLARRVAEHKGKFVRGFTRTYGVTLLVYFEEYSSVLDARARETVLKC